MRLGARVLRAVVTVNSFEHAQQFEHSQLSADECFVQLISLDSNLAGTPPGIRYLPVAGSIVTLTMPSIDASKVKTYTLTQAYAGDASIWKATITATDDFGSGNMIVTLTESAVVKKATIINGVRVTPNDPSRCVF